MDEIGRDLVPRYTPYQVGPRSEKNYTRESANEVWRLGRQPDGRTDTPTNKHRVLIELLPAAKHTKGHKLYASSGLIQKSQKMRIVGYNDFATLPVPSHLQKQRAPIHWSMHFKGSFGNVHQIQKRKNITIVAYMLQFVCFLGETYIWVCYPNKKMNLVMILYKAGDKPSP